MKKQASPQPPRWPLGFLRFFVKKAYLEEIEGDMEEVFYDDLETMPLPKARRRYALGVIKLLRPNLVRGLSFNHLPINFDMIFHHLTLFFRNIKRYKTTFFINLIGLSTGLASALLIFLWINDERSIDKFHAKDDHLYQVLHHLALENEILTIESTPGVLAAALEESFPEVEQASVVSTSLGNPSLKGVLEVAEQKIKARNLFVSANFFEVFSFNLMEGDPSAVFEDNSSILLSDEIAIKLFGTTKDLIGRPINWSKNQLSGDYIISGIFENAPEQSSLQFDVLFPYSLLFESDDRLHHWYNSDPSTFVVLRKDSDLKAFNKKLKAFSHAKFVEASGGKKPKRISSLFLQKFSNRHLFDKYENGKLVGGRISYVRLFSLIGLFLLAIACINFMNLSTARASRRLKEIGVKKVFGASRETLISQYLMESVLTTFIALFFAIVMVYSLLPQFNALTGKSLQFVLSGKELGSVLLIGSITGLFAGLYPGLYLSRFKPSSIFKGKITASVGERWARKGLVVFQFVVSIMLMVAVLVVFKQIQFINNKHLGFNKDNVIVFSNEGELENKLESFLIEAKKIPGVVHAASFGHDLTGDHGSTSGVQWPGKDPEHQLRFANLEVDHRLLDLFEFEIVEGRKFSREMGDEGTSIILNESAVEAMELKNPIGQYVKLWGKDRQIIGVVKDFHFASLYEDVGPCFFQCYSNLDNVLIKIKAGSESATIVAIKGLFSKMNNGLPFDYRFLDEDFDALYAAENRVAILSQYFAGIAILVSCLGLFGLATFSAERRLKEIGIRKILGSSTYRIVRLLSKDFSEMVLLAIIIALPISYLLAWKWLRGFAFHIDLQWWFFAWIGLLTLLISLLTVGTQTIRASRVDPVHCLREE